MSQQYEYRRCGTCLWISKGGIIKLNLGSGNVPLEGYVNIDIQEPCDLKHDLRQPLPYKDNSIDEIYTHDVIQHFSREEWKVIKDDWVRVLKPGGKLEIICHNLEYVLTNFLSCKEDRLKWGYWLIHIYGGEANNYDYFKNGFTYNTLMEDLKVMSRFEKDLDDIGRVHLRAFK